MSSQRPYLLIVATAPVLIEGEALRLDVKFVEGMRMHVAQWGGPVRCILRKGATAVPFGASYLPQDLGFELHVLDPDQPLGAAQLQDVGVIWAAADDPSTLALPPLARQVGAKLVYSTENTLRTRLQIVALDQGRGWLRKARSMLWNILAERRRRAALRQADGVQANGYPAYQAYRGMVRDIMIYLDGRMRPQMMATAPEMEARKARLRAGAPIRLIHSGRLETIKGAQDILAVMEALQQMGVPAELDIYGTGSLAGDIAAGLARFEGRVRLHPPVDFETELVPLTRAGADLFLSCHRQSDPSCTYIEAMGCGVTLVGYDNQMWSALSQQAGSGAVAPLGDIRALAGAIARYHHDRERLCRDLDAALDFAKKHDFVQEFDARMRQVKRLAQQD